MRHGGQILADQLKLRGVRRVFSVPGESFLAALDGLHESGIQNVVCRHEGGAAMMAEATGKMTGEPGICFVTRGPGATNAAAGVHVARQDSTPLILFVGDIERGHRDREAFQEVDFRAMFGPLAKWAAEIGDVARIPEYVARAFRVATSGRPGPVVLSLPEDMLNEEADVPDVAPPGPVLAPDLSGAVEEVLALLAGAERPLLIVGGPHWSAEAARNLAQVAEAQGLPVAAGFRRQDYLDNRHPHYAGDLNVGINPRLAQRLREADALLLLGTRLGDIESGGYTLLDPRGHGKRLIHVHADPDEPGRVWRPDLAVTATAPAFVAALARANSAGPERGEWVRGCRADYEWWQTPQETPGSFKQERAIRWLADHLAEDAILTNGAGNFAAFLHRYYSYRSFRTQLAPTSGSMGYGFPAAVAASLASPDRVVVCVAGDGDFQMTLNEMSTAVQFGAKPIVIVMNNGKYGTIRMHQERHFPGRVSGSDLANPDYAALARAYGGYGEVVTRSEDFGAAFRRACEWGTVAVVECRVDPEALTTGATVSQVREQALRSRA
jgi:acetolactate synthase-1/2/3 large subunit